VAQVSNWGGPAVLTRRPGGPSSAVTAPSRPTEPRR
jgi:hypothetical protein